MLKTAPRSLAVVDRNWRARTQRFVLSSRPREPYHFDFEEEFDGLERLAQCICVSQVHRKNINWKDSRHLHCPACDVDASVLPSRHFLHVRCVGSLRRPL